MENEGSFKYYYGYEAEQYSFYRIPKLLMTDEKFQGVSVEAKILYGILLDRMCLSAENEWLDDEGRVYIYFSLEDAMGIMKCKSEKATKLFNELDSKKGVGLIDRIKRGQGKPSMIYVKNFATNSYYVKRKSGRRKAANRGQQSPLKKSL